MIIGIDFDNTIINYSFLFSQIAQDKQWILSDKPLTKSEVKKKMLLMDGNDLRWQELQSIVYGHEIHQAKPFDYLLTFLKEVKKNNDIVYIISHKTKYSNYDKKTELIKPAYLWLKENKIIGNNGLISEKNLYFYPTRREKINKIKQIKCDIFIDDLFDVLADDSFPKKSFPLLFSAGSETDLIHVDKWKNILNFYRLARKYDLQWLISISKLLKNLVVDITPCNQGGNNFLQIVHCLNDEQYIVKRANKERLQYLKNEYNALLLLNKHHIKGIAKAVSLSEKRVELIQSYLYGKPIKKITHESLDRIVEFILSLEPLDKKQIPFINTGNYRNKYRDYVDAINTRWDVIKKNIKPLCNKYPSFNKILGLLKQLESIKEKVLNDLSEQIKDKQIDDFCVFPKEELIFNPSDFGFHNMLQGKHDELYFLDFEYFVYDDKAKMICDFIHHAGHELTIEQIRYFLRQLNHKGFFTPLLKQRILLLINVIGFEWLLIILNIAHKDKLKQKIHANPELSIDKLVETQYDKALQRLSFFQTNINDKKELFTLGIHRRELNFD